MQSPVKSFSLQKTIAPSFAWVKGVKRERMDVKRAREVGVMVRRMIVGFGVVRGLAWTSVM